MAMKWVFGFLSSGHKLVFQETDLKNQFLSNKTYQRRISANARVPSEFVGKWSWDQISHGWYAFYN